MKTKFLVLLLLLNLVAHAQFPFGERPSQLTAYVYPFYNGSQMIEIDYVGFHNNQIGYMEMSQPRSIPWSAMMPLMQQNALVFVDAHFQVVKKFNTSLSDAELLDIISKANTRSVSSHQERNLIWQIETPWQAPGTAVGNGYYRIFSLDAPTEQSFSFNYQTFGKTGIIDSLGNVVVPMIYDNLHGAGGQLIASFNSLVGMIDFQNKITLPFEYTSFEAPPTTFEKPLSEYYLFFKDKYCTKIFNRNTGTTKDIHPFNFYQPNQNGQFYICSYKNKFGVLNLNFEPVLPFEYDYVEALVDPSYVVVHQDKKWGILSYKNEVVLPLEYDDYYRNDWRKPMFTKGPKHFTFKSDSLTESTDSEILSFKQSMNNRYFANYIKGHPISQRDQRYGMLDSTLNIQLPFIYTKIQPIELYDSDQRYYQKAVIAEVNKLKGIIDLDGNILLPFEYDEIWGYMNRNMMLVQGNKKGYCDSTFKLVIPCVYQMLDSPQVEGQFIFSTGGKKTGVMTFDQKVIIPEIYDAVYGYYHDYYLITKDGLRGIADTAGNLVISISYEELAISPFNALLLFKQNGKWGIMNLQEKVILPAEYDQINVFEGEVTGVKKGDKWAFVNQKGKFKTDFIYDYIRYNWDVNRLVEVKYKGQVGFMNEELEVVINFLYDDCVGYSRDGYHFIKDNQHFWVKR
ncbi:MAG: WG repeat-containing protein [Flavobacteriales bacterium]